MLGARGWSPAGFVDVKLKGLLAAKGFAVGMLGERGASGEERRGR
jgi:hypothetical protein